MCKRKKICVVVTSLGTGGAERSAALLTKMLNKNNYQVTLVTIVNDINYQYEGTLLNLGALVSGNTFMSKIRKFIVFKNYLKSCNFDYIIDNRTRPVILREIIVSRFLYNPKKTIYCVRSYHLDAYFIKSKAIVKYLYKDAYKIVSVSKAIKNQICAKYKFDNVITIYNPVEHKDVKGKVEINEFILFFGRLVDHVKNISLLLEAYYESKLAKQGIYLMIMGSGKDLDFLKSKVAFFNLGNHVIFKPFTANPYPYIKASKFTVLTSHYEGFPRSIIESLALGTPVVSVNCLSGPNEIIKNEVNGLLVENYNSLVLASALNRLANDNELYKKCKENAKSSVESFSMEVIAREWKKLLN